MIKKIQLKNKLILLELFGSAENIFKATENDFSEKQFFDKKIIQIILSSQDVNDVLSYKSMLDKKGISFVSINEEEYPYLLKNIFEPPILLYYMGILPKKTDTLISVVGTRTPSTYGENVTYKVASRLAQENIGVVSGLAYGVDTIAHRGCVDNNGYTIAVLGCGIDTCYPSSNRSLMQKIIANGLVISEFMVGEKPIPANFPKRNRIIAGLSKATIVAEAPLKSGALITARLAISEGRDVLTFPADIFRKKSAGNNELIKDGATPITKFEDVLFAINFESKKTDSIKTSTNIVEKIQFSEDETLLVRLFSYDGVDADYLSLKSGMDIQKVQSLLTILEFKGIIMKLPNQKFVINKS